LQTLYKTLGDQDKKEYVDIHIPKKIFLKPCKQSLMLQIILYTGHALFNL